MSDAAPKKQTKPKMKRVDGPPKPPTKVTLDLDELGGSPPEDAPLAQMLTALGHAGETWHKLFVLHGGGRPLKRESLELSLDRNIVLLGKLIPKVEPRYLRSVAQTFRLIRNYRRDYPRTNASNQEQAEQAQRILDEFPEV